MLQDPQYTHTCVKLSYYCNHLAGRLTRKHSIFCLVYKYQEYRTLLNPTNSRNEASLDLFFTTNNITKASTSLLILPNTKETEIRRQTSLYDYSTKTLVNKIIFQPANTLFSHCAYNLTYNGRNT